MNATKEPVKLPADAISTGEAARLVGASINTVRRWIEIGKLRAWYRGTWLMVSRADVLGMVREYIPVAREPAPRTRQEMERAARDAIERIQARRGRRSRREDGQKVG